MLTNVLGMTSPKASPKAVSSASKRKDYVQNTQQRTKPQTDVETGNTDAIEDQLSL